MPLAMFSKRSNDTFVLLIKLCMLDMMVPWSGGLPESPLWLALSVCPLPFKPSQSEMSAAARNLGGGKSRAFDHFHLCLPWPSCCYQLGWEVGAFLSGSI